MFTISFNNNITKNYTNEGQELIGQEQGNDKFKYQNADKISQTE